MRTSDRIMQMIAWTRQCIAGGLTASELRTRIDRLTADQCELPLCTGSTTEAPKQ